MFKSYIDEDKTKITRLNKELLDEKVNFWGEKEIIDRADRLSEIIIDKYPYPKNIDTSLEFEKYYEFYIDNPEDDADEYVDNPNYKLYGFQYDGVKYRASYFKNIYVEMVKILYSTNPAILDGVKEKLLEGFRNEEEFGYMAGCEPWEKLIFDR